LGSSQSVPASDRQPALAAAAVLGGVSGMRTFTAPGILALRGRWGRGAVGRALPVLAAGELIGDKLPFMPPRSDPPSLLGRIASGTAIGAATAGPRGAGAAAAGAAATTLASERLRSQLGERLGVPDPLLGLAEDALAVAVATQAARITARRGAETSPAAPSNAPDPGGAPDLDGVEGRPPGRPVGALARGLAAAAVGTAAMTTVQTAYMTLTGASASHAPEQLGRRLIEGVGRRRVPRNRRDQLNQGMHIVYGTSWGVPLGLVTGSLDRRPPASVVGLGLGLAAWGTSLVVLPALGVSPPPWSQSPGALASDLAMHLVFGGASAATLAALGG
jgi:uncharacterized membrane protein